MVGPHYDIARVREAAETDRVRLGRRRCVELLLPYLGELLICRAFVRQVTRLLRHEDFIQTNHHMTEGPRDEYGVELTDEVAAQFNLENDRTWYLKIKMFQSEEEELYFISFHRPERPLRRVGGTLKP